MAIASTSQPAVATPFNNALNGFSAKQVQKAIEESKNLSNLYNFYASATGTVTRTLNSPAVIGSMTLTPTVAGTYYFLMVGSASTGGVNGSGTFGLYKNGSLVPETNETISCTAAILGLVTLSSLNIRVPLMMSTKIAMNGTTDTLDARFQSNDGQTISVYARNIIGIRIGS